VNRTPTAAERAFVEATDAIAVALEQDDPQSLPDLISRQHACFEVLRAEGNASSFAAVVDDAESTLALARGRLVEIRKELERVRDARRVAARLRGNEPTARFISRRV